MIRPLTSIIIAAALTSCGVDGASSTGERYANRELGFATSHPETWHATLVRGHVEFVTTKEKLAKHTIVVRASDKPREIREGVGTNTDNVIATTEQVLRATPRSQAVHRSALDGAELPGARFSLTFVPRGLTKPYRRDHVVLVGKHRLFHVVYTAPAGEPADESAFKDIVTTLVEEG